MDELNNHQMILLSTLVAFITSIATGIITVALLEEAPQTVTQTVNRVVERTIERVVTGTSTPEKQTEPTTITREVTKEVTVYAKEDDLLIGAVEKNQSRMAQIYPSKASTSTPPVGIGFMVSRDGLIVTTSSNLTNAGELAKDFQVAVGDKRFAAHVVEVKDAPPVLSFLSIKDATPGTTFEPVTFGSKMDPKLGQTVVAIGGDEGTSIFKTTLSRFVYEKTEGTSSPQVLGGIEVNPKIPDGYNGSLVSNLDGQVVGISVWNDESSRYVIFPALRLFNIIQASSGKGSTAQTSDQVPPTQG